MPATDAIPSPHRPRRQRHAIGSELEDLFRVEIALEEDLHAGELLQLGDARADLAANGSVALVAGFVAALFAGIVAIRIFVGMLRHGTFHWFAVYCWAAGGAYLIAALFLPHLP